MDIIEMLKKQNGSDDFLNERLGEFILHMHSKPEVVRHQENNAVVMMRSARVLAAFTPEQIEEEWALWILSK